MLDTQKRYRYWRTHGLTAKNALSYVREEQRYAATLARFDGWEFEPAQYGGFARADMDAGRFTIRVLVGDEDAPDWGDIEYTDAEVEARASFYVAVQVLEGDDEVYHDGIGGVDVIDLDGYLQRDWEDAAAFALNDYLLDAAERFVALEDSERAEWAARDTVTVQGSNLNI
jgi:hypothetical protein